MGLFDSVAGAVLGKVLGGEQGNMAQVAMEMFNQHGGLPGILDKFNNAGLSTEAASWVGSADCTSSVGESSGAGASPPSASVEVDSPSSASSSDS